MSGTLQLLQPAKITVLLAAKVQIPHELMLTWPRQVPSMGARVTFAEPISYRQSDLLSEQNGGTRLGMLSSQHAFEGGRAWHPMVFR